MVGPLAPAPEPSLPPTLPETPSPGVPPSLGGRSPDSGTDSEKSKYQEYELQMLWSLSGHNPETFPALTESALPTFWQRFKKHRSSNTEARNFMESYLRSWKTTERIVTPFIWQPSVIRAARTLNFGADDIAFSWEIRDRGFSYLMLGPHEAFNSGNYVMTTDDWKLLELAEDDGKLTLEERRSSRRSGGLCPDVPGDRMTTVRHMECVSDKLLMMFGDKNPISPYLNSFVAKVSEDPVMGSWRSDDWKSFNWLVASGVRKVFNECHGGVDRNALSFLVRINNDLTSGRRFAKEECPVQLFASGSSGTSSDGGGKRKGEGLSRQPPKKAGGRTPPTGSSHPMAENFSPLIREAKAALKSRRFGVGALLQSKEDVNYVFGEDFRGLVRNGEGCTKFFLNKCFKEDCPFCHELKSNPTKPVIEGMVRRFKEKLDAYVAKEAAKN